jgi:aspartyl/glutamyl-tRNA(Asn/Gln) amidotransferase C subunit
MALCLVPIIIFLPFQVKLSTIATMESISKDQVFHIAKLSRLHLEEREAEQYATDLAAILDYASHLPEVQAKPELSLLRVEDDIADPYPNPEELLQNAVALENGSVKVPSILDKGAG